MNFRATADTGIYRRAADLCRIKPITLVEWTLLASLAFAAGWTLAVGFSRALNLAV